MPPLAEDVWRQGTERLAQQAAAGVQLAYSQLEAGGISQPEATAIQATKIAVSQLAAVTFNDALLSRELTAKNKDPYAPAGIQWWEKPDEQAARLGKALSTLYSDDIAYTAGDPALQSKSVRARLDRLTVNEVGRASHWSRDAAVNTAGDEGALIGWIWRTRQGACDRCKAMTGHYTAGYAAKYGGKVGTIGRTDVHPISHRFPDDGRHPRCHCFQEVVTELAPGQRMMPESADKYRQGPAPIVRTASPVESALEPGWKGGVAEAKGKLPPSWSDQQMMRPDGTPTDLANQHLDSVMEAGRHMDDELERRLAARAKLSPEATRQAQVDLTKARMASTDANRHLSEAENKLWDDALAKAKAAGPALPRDMTRAEFIELANAPIGQPGYQLARFSKYDVQREMRKPSSAYGKAKAKAVAAAEDFNRVQGRAEGKLVPGTAAHAEALREEVLGILSEVRTMGGKGVYVNAKGAEVKTGKAIKAMRFADSSYPSDWHDQHEVYLAGKGRSGTMIGSAKRGYNRGGYEIRLSTQSGRGHRPEGDIDGQYQVATHELGHSFEKSVPGLSQMEFAFSHRRSPRATEKITSIYGREMGYKDQWQSHYTGKQYANSPTGSWEIFTTGAESLLSGSPYLERTAAAGGYDREFRQFLLGVLSAL